MRTRRLFSVKFFALVVLTACGGGGASAPPGPPPPPPPPTEPPPVTITKAEAYRFLNQSTFGATEASAQTVIDGGFEGWIDEQLAMPASLQLPYLQTLPRPSRLKKLQADRVDIWFRNTLRGKDQLRQRVAFALSEILVVSQVGSSLIRSPYGLADYYDLLARNAFGNYRDLIEAVTLHPAMGVYLSMLGNERPDAELNIRPDENYARELMQLFSIGLVELDDDGGVVLDAEDQPVPTYDQSVIEGFAHVFTGWTYADAPAFREAVETDSNQVTPMQLYPDFHDSGSKKLLNGELLPPGQEGTKDLSDALNNVFNHANVAPFMVIRLIQRLVTSNPSPDYVGRVASVFNDNGFGVRGDLGAVVKAILLDDEARTGPRPDADGKLKEPLLRLTQLWRAYNASSRSGRFLNAGETQLEKTYAQFGQGPLQSPSVFNFFSPFYASPGEVRDLNLVAPELEIATEYLNTAYTNFMLYQCYVLHQANPGLDDDEVYIDIFEEMAIAQDADALIDRVADKLLAGEISDTLRSEINGMLALISIDDTAARVAEAIYFVVTSPEYAHQK